jgi:ADP-ribose pyrophosphatase YjhB (NUDIX family)
VLGEAAIAIVRDNEGRVLTVTRPEPPHEQALPGGHVEDGETPCEAVARELAEECGVRAAVVRHIETTSSPTSGMPVDIFDVVEWSGTPSDVEGAGDVSWLTPLELLDQATLFAPTVRDLIGHGHLTMSHANQLELISADKRNSLPGGKFALPALRKYPIDTAARTRNAAARLEQMHKAGKISDEEYGAAKKRIAAAAKKFGIESRYNESAHDEPRRAPMAPGRLHVAIDHPQHGHFEIRHMRDNSGSFRQAVELASSAADGDKPVWVQISTRGTFKGHGAGQFTLDDETFKEIVRNYRDVDGGQVAFDYEHASEQDPTEGTIPVNGAPAQGWIKDLRIAPDGLHALVEWLEPAKTQIREKKYKFVSPAIRFGARHPVTGQPIGARLTSVALTNAPFLRGLQPLAAKDRLMTTQDVGSQTVTASGRTLAFGSHEFMPKIRACLDMHELSTPAQCAERMKALSELHDAGGGADTLGVPVGKYVDRLRDAMRMPMTATVEEMFGSLQEMLAAAQAEHEETMHPGRVAASDDDVGGGGGDVGMSARRAHGEIMTTDNATTLKDVTTKLSAAEAQNATLTLQLNERMAKVATLESEIVRLKAEGETRDKAELEARVEEAFETHKDAQKLTDKHKPLMLASAKADRKAFDEVYPRISPAQRHLLRDLTGTGGSSGHREPPARSTNAGADAQGDLTVETHADTAMRLMKADPNLSIAMAISEASRLRAAGEVR